MGLRTVFYLLPLALACSEARPAPEPAAPAAPPSAPAAAAPERSAQASVTTQEALTRIADPSTVCMINDQHMGVAQIPVNVDGKTYYGCCQMCEAKLKTQPESRLGTDPVSGKPVDKASAVLAKDARGKVLYFENAANFDLYASRL